MKYRHQYHAGNFADVHKHVLLLEVLRALTRKDKGLLFVDTHAGRGDYDLHPGDSEHPAEWQAGAAKLLAATPRARGTDADTATGSRRARTAAACIIRAHRCSPLARCGRSIAPCSSKRSARRPAHLRKVLPGALRARVEIGDGFRDCARLLPPPERRGCVLIDPPYEDRADSVARASRP